MNIDTMFPSDYLKASDCSEGDLTLTIKKVVQENVGQGQDKAEIKPVVRFDELDKGLVLNKTNANIISDLYSKDTSAWTGKKIILYETEASFQGRMVPALRVKPIVPPTSSTVGAASGPTDEAWNYYISLCEQAGEYNIEAPDVPDDISAKNLHLTCQKLKKEIQAAVAAEAGGPAELPF